MSLEDATLRAIREYIGTAEPPTDADLEERYTRLGDADRVALEVLRERRAEMIASPLKFSVDGDFAEDATANLKALDALIAGLAGSTDGSLTGPSELQTMQLNRSDRRR